MRFLVTAHRSEPMTVINLEVERWLRRGGPSAARCEACGGLSRAALCQRCTAAYEALCKESWASSPAFRGQGLVDA